jgi:hypothetical protein
MTTRKINEDLEGVLHWSDSLQCWIRYNVRRVPPDVARLLVDKKTYPQLDIVIGQRRPARRSCDASAAGGILGAPSGYKLHSSRRTRPTRSQTTPGFRPFVLVQDLTPPLACMRSVRRWPQQVLLVHPSSLGPPMRLTCSLTDAAPSSNNTYPVLQKGRELATLLRVQPGPHTACCASRLSSVRSC